MIIDRHLGPHVVYHEDAIQHALHKMNRNTRRMVFCISESGVLDGIVTDGDFRRWVVNVEDIDLQRPVRDIANHRFTSARIGDEPARIEALFSPKITSIPLLDASGRLAAIAWRENDGLRIGSRVIRDDKPAFLIAEIGNNHNGSLDLAKRLIDEAARAGADCAKFQLRDMESLYAHGGKAVSEDLGAEYTLDLLRRFQLSPDEMFQALDHTRACGLVPLCTPWDLVSLKRLNEYGLEGFKIASADLTNHELVRAAARTGRPLIVSTGMSVEHEIREAVGLLRSEGAAFALLQCNSTYPTPMQDVNLAYMNRLKDIGGVPIGYSGHERGYEVCIAAIARGAKVIEKHFTLDRNMEGNDHRVSLLPDEFEAMVKAIRNVELAMGTGDKREISQGERLNREVLAKSLVAARDLRAGEIITADMLETRSPGRGLQPSRTAELVGVAACRDMKKGDLFFETDIAGQCVRSRDYAFDRPWGIPIRYHDFATLAAPTKADLVEIHFSYRDLDLDPAGYFQAATPFQLVVHSPELFAGDHIMDLSSDDEAYRNRSIAELQRVIDRTRELKRFFPATERPPIIINAGGFTADQFMPHAERARRYDRIADALRQVNAEGVEIIPQTMPPFPWHFGGQRFHNLFMAADETVAFCKRHGMRVCLDISHSRLACNHFGWSWRDFVRDLGPFTAHLHVVDAKGAHDEGLQIGDGDIDFESLGADLDRWAPGVGFIPEIWQGHKNQGEGFWVALDRLEKAWSARQWAERLAA